jgi:predicted nucleotidyltransferase
MRKNPIDTLFPKIRQQILAATYGQPERWWFLSELANFIGVSPSSLQRELKSLVASGILHEKRDGNRLYVQAESNSPIFSPLRELIAKTLGIKSVLEDALRTLSGKIDCAFIYGSVARGEEHTSSDVDIMIIGQIGLSDISKILRPLEKRLNREINATCYQPEEFTRKIESGNHFLTSVLQKEKSFLIGDSNELDKLAGKQDSTKSHDQPAGNR